MVCWVCCILYIYIIYYIIIYIYGKPHPFVLGWKDLVHWDHLDRHVISPGPVDFLRLTTLPAPPRTVKPRKWTYMDQNCLICFILSPTERAYSSYSTLQDAPGKPYPECAAGEEPPGHFGESTLECLECTFESLGFAGISWTILKDNNMIWFYVNLNVYIAQRNPSPLKHWGYTNNENITQVLPTESYGSVAGTVPCTTSTEGLFQQLPRHRGKSANKDLVGRWPGVARFPGNFYQFFPLWLGGCFPLWLGGATLDGTDRIW